MKLKTTVSVTLIYALLKYAASIGIDSKEVWEAVGVQPPAPNDPEKRLPAEHYYALWLAVVERAKDPNFGLHFAEMSRHQPSGGVLSVVMFNCPSAGEAMQKLAQYHDLATDFIQIRARTQGQYVRYAWETNAGTLSLERHISEAVICWLFFTLQGLSDGKIVVNKILFRHPQPVNTSEHERIFNCPVLFEQRRDEIVVQRKSLDFPIPLSDPRILNRLDAIAQEMLDSLYAPDSWTARVSQEIRQVLLHAEKPSLSRIAEQLAISTRHLQNKLKAEGTSYRNLLEEMRKEMALSYLKEPNMGTSDIAFLLGFSDQSAFNHAFKRWTGTTPGKYQP